MRTYGVLLAVRRLVATAYGISKTGIRIAPSVSSTQVGEDAYFIALSSTTSGFDICGVADGVGGWNEANVNPARFSRGLMDECVRLAKAGNVSRPSEFIKAAYEAIIHPTSNCYGGSTVCLLSLDRANGILHTANLGDSGFMVLRNGQILTKSSELQHYFNCPYQLTNPPPNISTAGLILDSPSSAKLTSLEVLNGDIVVLATDGFFDNIHDEEVRDLLSGVKDHSGPSLMKACVEVVSTAYTHSNDRKYCSPFAEKLSLNAIGGKPDDITAIMAAVYGHQ